MHVFEENFSSNEEPFERFMVTELSVHYTSGSNVRVDTTLLGFHNMRWQRGHQSFLFATDSEWLSLVTVTQF